MKESKQNNSNVLNSPNNKYLQIQLKQNQLPIKNFGIFSSYNSNSNSFRQTSLKTSSKASPRKSANYKLNNKEEMIFEQNEIEDNALEYIKKKFMKKKNSNYLNYTNPINYPKKVYGSRHEIIRNHFQNSNSISLNYQNNNKFIRDNIIEEKNKTLNYSVNKNITSPRDNYKGKNIKNIKVKNNSKYRLRSGIHEKKVSMKIFDKLMKNKKDNLNITSQLKKIAYTTLNSRKNSNEKRLNKLINKKKKNNNNKINIYNNNHLIQIKEKKISLNNKSSYQQSENSSIINSININNITSCQVNNNNINSSNPFSNNNVITDNKKMINQKGFFPLTAPLSKQTSKANSKQKKGSREKIKKSKIEKLNLINLKKNYTSANSPNHYIINNNKNNGNKENSLINNYLFPKNKKLSNYILKKNLNSNINKLINDFKNDISFNHNREKNKKKETEKSKNKKELNYIKTTLNETTIKLTQLTIEKKSKSKDEKKKKKIRNYSQNSILEKKK